MQLRERRPIHPGEILAEDVLAELEMSGRQLASALGISPNRISEILRGRRAITADTALRLSRWLGTSPTVWLNLQQAYDLEMAKIQAGEVIERDVKPRDIAARARTAAVGLHGVSRPCNRYSCLAGRTQGGSLCIC